MKDPVKRIFDILKIEGFTPFYYFVFSKLFHIIFQHLGAQTGILEK